MDLAIFWKGVLLGLGAAAPIGPVNVEIARRSVHAGWRAGMLVGGGASTVDVVYAALAALGLRMVSENVALTRVMAVAGAAFLAYLGAMSLLAARKSLLAEERQPQPAEGGGGDGAVPAEAPRRHYVTGVLMNCLNPMILVFWFLTPNLIVQSRPEAVPWACLGVAGGTMAWVAFFATLMAFAGTFSKRITERVADIAGGLMLLGFAIWSIWRVFVRPL